MRVSIPWLNKFVSITQSAADLADLLTMLGLEAELPKKASFTGIVVGEVLKAEKHPNADRLSLCIVSDGQEEFQVVCGAPNVAVDQKVAFAKVGALLENDFKITKAKIRGEHSFGMICSERELGLSEEHEGILVLNDGAEVGSDFAEYLNSNQEYLDIDLTPNRPDCMSHVGVAREIVVKTGQKLKYSPNKPRSFKQNNAEDILSIKIEDKDRCPRYVAGVVINVEVKDSPEWLIKLLESVGQRSINNIVDISNYILFEMGHPTHIFDYDKIPSQTIGIRKAKKGEKVKTLDEEKRLLTDELVITDGKDPIALAGVMGGLETAVTEKTKNVLIESAYFDPITIRRGSKSLGLSTEASKRFERGADPNAAVNAYWRVVDLLEELAGGEWVPGIIDVYPNKIDQPRITLTREKIDILSGCELTDKFIKDSLTNLGIEIKKDGKGKWNCTPPSFRPDLEREVDLIEELCRIYGYEKIHSNFHFSGLYDHSDVDTEESFSSIIEHLSSLGMSQCYANSLTDENIANLHNKKAVQMKNPLNENMSHLRTSLFPGLLEIAQHNINNGNPSLALFEIGKKYTKEKKNYIEEQRLTAVFHGNRIEKNVHIDSESYSEFSTKGIVGFLIDLAKLDEVTFKSIQDPIYSIPLGIFQNSVQIGTLGQINSEFLRSLDLDSNNIFGFDINIDVLSNSMKNIPSYRSIVPFPKVDRDMNFVMDQEVKSMDVTTVMMKNGRSILRSVKPVDIFTHDSLGENKKSVTFHLIFQNDSKTLEDSEINSVMNDITAVISKNFNAKLRD